MDNEVNRRNNIEIVVTINTCNNSYTRYRKYICTIKLTRGEQTKISLFDSNIQNNVNH